MGRSLAVRRDSSSEAVQVDMLVCIVELQNLTNTVYYLEVLVLNGVKVVQAVPVLRRTIGQREIYGD